MKYCYWGGGRRKGDAYVAIGDVGQRGKSNRENALHDRIEGERNASSERAEIKKKNQCDRTEINEKKKGSILHKRTR